MIFDKVSCKEDVIYSLISKEVGWFHQVPIKRETHKYQSCFK